MFQPWGRCSACSLINLPNLLIIFLNFLHSPLDVAQITTSFNHMPPLMCVHTSHRPYGYPFLMLCPWQWMHWDPWCNSQHFCCHCMGCWLSCGMKIITCASFNDIQFLSSMSWHYFYKICTLIDVVIANPMHVNLLLRSCITQGFTTFNTTQVKEMIDTPLINSSV